MRVVRSEPNTGVAADARKSWFYAINDWSCRSSAGTPSTYADLCRFQCPAQHGGQRHSSMMRPSRVGWRVRRQAAFSPIELRSGSIGGDSAPQSTQW
jgi:hypothetical protein